MNAFVHLSSLCAHKMYLLIKELAYYFQMNVLLEYYASWQYC